MTISIEKYTEGLCGDGAAILCGGVQMTISQILTALNTSSRDMAELIENNERLSDQLLAVREAQSVPVESVASCIVRDGSMVVDGFSEHENSLPDGVHDLYATPPAPAVPAELLNAMAEVIRISDRDHEAWDRAKAAISSCRAAMFDRQSVYHVEQALSPAPAVIDERLEFETLIENEFGNLIDRSHVKNGGGGYFAWDMQVAWRVWQGRAKLQSVSQGYTFDGLNIRAVAALRSACSYQWLNSKVFADKVHWQNMHSIANEIMEAMAAAPTPTKAVNDAQKK